MSLAAATRRPVSARTSVSRQRTTVVKCSAQPPSAARQLMAAGAALAMVLGPVAMPAHALDVPNPFNAETQEKFRETARNPMSQNEPYDKVQITGTQNNVKLEPGATEPQYDGPLGGADGLGTSEMGAEPNGRKDGSNLTVK